MTRRRTARRGLGAILACGLAACGGPARPRIEIDSPLERQVVQREEPDDAALVTIRGTLAGEVANVEFQAELATGRSMRWETAALTPPEAGRRRFSAHLRLPAGGWHTIWARTTPGSQPTRVVERIGIGEVFITAGQSNATNSGEAPFPALNDRVSAFDGRSWSTARDPMPGMQDRSAGGSPWPVFGDRLATALEVPVGIACVGRGNSSIDDWQPDGPLFPALRERLTALRRIRAVLWHQGERDAARGMSAADYVAKFQRLRDGLARDTGQSPFWIVARASFLPDTDQAAMREIRLAQETLWRQGDALPGPSTDELRGGVRARDDTHFNPAGLRLHGELWFAQVWAALYPAGSGP